MFAPTSKQRSGGAETESFNSRSRLRCTTRVEISTSEPESGHVGREGPLSTEEVYEEVHGNKVTELRALEPVHLPVPSTSHHRA